MGGTWGDFGVGILDSVYHLVTVLLPPTISRALPARIPVGNPASSMYKTGYTITNFATLFAGDAGEAADAIGTLDRLTLETTDAAGQTLKAARNEADAAQLLTPGPGTDFHLPVT